MFSYRVRARTWQSVEGDLSIRGLLRTDAGLYLCKADNGVGSALVATARVMIHGEGSRSRYRTIRQRTIRPRFER